jgi:hypothetical protein
MIEKGLIKHINTISISADVPFKPVLCIRIGFHADPNPAFKLNTDPEPGSQPSADPYGPGSGSWSDF